MDVPFLKMHGLGNDYVYLDVIRHPQLADLDFPALARAVSDRHRGIGSDGLILILPGGRNTDVGMRIFNRDGSEGEICGNGVRCVMRYARARGYAPATMTVGARGGPVSGEVQRDGQVCVDMGVPALTREAIGFTGHGALRDTPVDAAGEERHVTGVSVGNPHLVVFAEPDEDLAALALRVGPALEEISLAPRRTNVEFARVLAPDRIAMEVWERGSGRTLACGAGACATLVAAAWTGRSGRDAELELAGGRLHISWANDDHVFMSGPASFSFRGVYVWQPEENRAATWDDALGA